MQKDIVASLVPGYDALPFRNSYIGLQNHIDRLEVGVSLAMDGKRKIAFDSARILDLFWPFRFLNEKEYVPEIPYICPLLWEIFNDLEKLCLTTGVLPPAPDITLYLPVVRTLIKQTSDEKDGNLAERKAAAQSAIVKSLIEVERIADNPTLRIFAELAMTVPSILQEDSFSGITGNQISAVINANLIAMGKRPIFFPKWRDTGMKDFEFPAAACHAPQRSTRIVAVDDFGQDIIKTLSALRGWENIELDFLWYLRKREYGSLSGEEKDERLAETAQKLLNMKPNVVLMDGGLGDLEGHELILAIKKDALGRKIRFVANTGGDPKELMSVGAHGNCAKGMHLHSLQDAVEDVEDADNE